MKVRLLYAALASCLCLSSVASAQSGPILMHGGGGPSPITPEEQALTIKIELSDNVAADALYAGRNSEAEIDARQSLSLGQDSGIAQEVLAAALNAQGKEQEALQEYQVMASQGDDHPRNLLPYALLLKSGQWASAVAVYNQALPLTAEGEMLQTLRHFSAALRHWLWRSLSTSAWA